MPEHEVVTVRCCGCAPQLVAPLQRNSVRLSHVSVAGLNWPSGVQHGPVVHTGGGPSIAASTGASIGASVDESTAASLPPPPASSSVGSLAPTIALHAAARAARA